MPKIKESFPRKFHYCGDGLGIAGLPHDVTEEEARALGVLDVLQAALKNGSYREVTDRVTSSAHPAEEETS
jgi:hypothetical protein